MNETANEREARERIQCAISKRAAEYANANPAELEVGVQEQSRNCLLARMAGNIAGGVEANPANVDPCEARPVRITWLNPERTKARVITGWLWWRRVAIVHRDPDGIRVGQDRKINWHHAGLGDGKQTWVTHVVDYRLDRARNWYRPGDEPATMPAARTVPKVVKRDDGGPVNL